MPVLRWLAFAGLLSLAGVVIAFDRWIDATPMPELSPAMSAVVLDRNGALLRAYTIADGRWRLPVAPEDVDAGYLAQLVAYEDRRFDRHGGVDPLALVRAALQAVRAGRIVSGGSTLTMQVARLLEAGRTGDITAKIRQTRLALALERRLEKREILGLYLVLAPFGGNIEGVRAASLAYFGKEPRRLTPAQSALLVALPQAPERRRPDRDVAAARAARDRALARAVAAGVLDAEAAAAARREAIPLMRQGFPVLAPHLADRLVAADPGARSITTTLDRGLQARLEALLGEAAAAGGPSLSAALIVADHRTGEVRAAVGSAGYLDTGRRGFIDMTRAVRSPGSTLKPLIYGLAFEAGLAHPETLVEDRPMRFGNYVPQNLDGENRGTLSVRAALQQSRNIPAVAMLDAVGPAQLLARLRRAGVAADLPGGRPPGLAVALGGLGVTLHDLVALYAGLARGGAAVRLRETPGPAGPEARFLSPNAAWQVADILAGTAPPGGAAAGRIAYKTGTSYGHRDAWAIGFDGAHVIGVWFGRADAAAMPGVLGLEMAAPVLFEAFARLAPELEPLPPPPASVLTVRNADLPQPLRVFRDRGAAIGPGPDAPEIAFPPDGARVDLGLAFGREGAAPLVVKLRSGSPPFRWLIDGVPLAAEPQAREAVWQPDGAGYVSIAVIDADGAVARARVFVQ